jgi:hypothetical protein
LEKLKLAAQAAALFAPSFPVVDVVDSLEDFVRRESETKFRGLYVDWEAEANAVAEPADVAAEDARAVVSLLGELVGSVAGHDLGRLAPNLAEIDLPAALERSAADVHQLVRHLRSLDPVEADALARRTADELVAGLRTALSAPNR